jgi:hypothetical protein
VIEARCFTASRKIAPDPGGEMRTEPTHFAFERVCEPRG